MRWIRSPAWDACWIWSGIPVGLMLATAAWYAWQPLTGFRGTMVERPLYWFFVLVVLLETGHVISPIVLVWSHSRLRKMAIVQRNKFIWLALAAFCASALVGVVTNLGWTSFTPGRGQIFKITDWTNPLPVLVWLYLILNAYHFGMQNFGVAQLYKRLNGLPGYRWVTMVLAVGLTAAAIAFLRLTDIGGQTLGFFALGVISVNHWLVEIGLSGRVSGRPWLFTLAVLAIGAGGFAWLVPTAQGTLALVIPVIVGVRMGLSFVHFLYDRWIWRMSDPLMREIVGKELFT